MKAGTEKLQKVLCCLLVLICFVNGISATTTISTNPPNNPLATGFNNLIVTAQFPTPTSSSDACFWYYGGELDSGSGASFYSGVFGCDPPFRNDTYDNITCTEQTIDGTSHIITTLTITQPLYAENINIEVGCIIATNTPGPINRTVQNCSSSLPYGVVITSSSQTYQASGMFSCPTGDLFYSNGTALPSSDTTCLANAEWSGQDNLQCWMAPSVTLASSSIDGDKLTVVEGNDLNLICNYGDVIPAGNTSRLYVEGNNYTRTQGEPFILSTLQRRDNNKIVLCQAVTPYTDVYPGSGRSSQYTLNVLYVPDTVNITAVLTDFTIPAENEYLLRSDENLTVQCIYSEANPSLTCNFTLYMVGSTTVRSVSGCSISYDLDQSSLVSCTAGNNVGSRSSYNQTITVVPAQRILHFNVDGANVTDNNVTSYLGENVTFSCSIGFSDELKTSFYFFHESNNIGSEQSFGLTLQPSDTGNYSCTSMDSFGNYSASIYLDVLYISESITNKIATSNDVIESSESNYLLRSDQQLTMNCNPSDANPPATCSWQLCSDSRCQTLTSDGGCLITVDLNASSTVTCTASNRAGNITSAEQTVDVVPVERQVLFNLSGSNVTNDSSINSTTYLGESIMMYCSVSYENELSTTYSLKLPNNSAVAQSSIQFPSVSRFNTGGYDCHTNDQFGNFSAAIYLNVIYAATQDVIPTCDWNLNETGICSVVFFSNPNSQFVSLSKGEQTVASDDSTVIKSTGDQGQQTFTFTRTQVENSDVGRYNLTVKSSNNSLFPNSVLYFNIVIEGNGGPPGTSGLSTGAIAGIIAGVVVVILCAAGYGVYRWRRGSQKKNGSPSNELYPNGSDNHAQGGGATHSNPAFNGDPEKELKINPIYASGGPTYAQVDKKNKSKNASDDNFSGNGASTSRDQPGAAYAQVDVKKKKKKKGSSEKEEKINPIYEAGDQPAPIEEAYAEVDKKKNKKGSDEKEERINPLYGSSESPDQLEAAYAEVDKKKKKKNKKGLNEKEERINPLYGSSQSPDQVEAAYAEVDKKKKKKNKKGSSEKEEKVNPLYVSSDQPEPTEAAYAEVDKNKKTKQSGKEERINPLYEASSSQDQVEAAYAEVDKSKRKQKAPALDTIQVEESSNATYADVNKPKKKKKPPPPSRQTTDTTQVEESSNATYAEVNKPKKKQKPPSRANNAGGDGSYDDVDLHGSSSTKIDPQKLMLGISQRRQQWSQN